MSELKAGKCPVCGSTYTTADFDWPNAPHVGKTMSVLCDCHTCGSDWLAVYNFSHYEEVYDAIKERA